MNKYVELLLIQFLLMTNVHCMLKNPAERLAAQEYNRNIALNCVSKDLSHYMFQTLLHPNNPIKENIRTILVLSTVCTQLNDFQYYVKLLEKHDSDTKNTAFIEIIESINDPNCISRRKPLILLLHSGADPNGTTNNGDFLLQEAICYNDIPMVALLSYYKANFNRNSFSDKPLFFHAETPEIANFFAHHGVDLNVSIDLYPNVLWYCCGIHYNSENINSLVQFYLDKKVDLGRINERKECILHNIANRTHTEKISISYKKSVELFLITIPHLINSLNKNKKTPLDVAMENVFCSDDIIELFKKYGAKRAIELK